MDAQPRILMVGEAASELEEVALSAWGALIERASSETEALHQLAQKEHALILLDVRAAEANGFDLATRIRQHQRYGSTPIIFLDTAYRSQACQKSYSFGMADYLAAPVHPDALKAKLEMFLQFWRKGREGRNGTAPAAAPGESGIEHKAESEISELNHRLTLRAAELEHINRELERQIRIREQAEAALKETNGELEAFSYSVSHDLRAPLRAMQGFAEALLEDCGNELGEVGREYAVRIVSAANRMDTLVQDVLRYSRISYSELSFERVDLEMAIADAIRQLEAQLIDKSASLSVRPPIPCVVGHHSTIVQVISNLISNGIKFVAPGVQPRIQLWAEVNSGTVRVWVEDNGIGIAKEYQNRIFRVFERLHGADSYPGTGIGLAIVRKGIERMGGAVGVLSTLKEGSRFWVELPLAPEQLDGPESPARTAQRDRPLRK